MRLVDASQSHYATCPAETAAAELAPIRDAIHILADHNRFDAKLGSRCKDAQTGSATFGLVAALQPHRRACRSGCNPRASYEVTSHRADDVRQEPCKATPALSQRILGIDLPAWIENVVARDPVRRVEAEASARLGDNPHVAVVGPIRIDIAPKAQLDANSRPVCVMAEQLIVGRAIIKHVACLFDPVPRAGQ